MFLKQEYIENSDLVRCPITKEIIRHPILASDERHYELKALAEWINITSQSPTNFIPISTVIYDIKLKERLDNYNSPNRYENYEKEPLLSTLIETINPEQQRSFMHYSKRIAFTVNGYLLFFSLYMMLFDDAFVQLNPSHLIFSIFLIGLSDCAIRFYSNNKYSLFTAPDFAAEIFESAYTSYSAKAKLSSNMS